jgi:hypothetical protein
VRRGRMARRGKRARMVGVRRSEGNNTVMWRL